MKFIFLVIIGIFLGGFCFSNSAEELKKYLQAYRYTRYQEAINGLKSLLYPKPRLEKKEQIIKARKYLSFALVLIDKKIEAKKEFKKLLQLAPEFELSPALVLPEIVSVFREAKQEYIKELAAKVKEEKPKVPEKDKSEQKKKELRKLGVVRKYFPVLANFLPFGYPQFRRGKKGKGFTFLTVELASLALSILANYEQARRWNPDYGTYYPPKEHKIARQWNVVQKVSFWTAVLSYVIGVVDAWLTKEE